MGDKKKGIGKERLKQLLEYFKGKFDNIVEDVTSLNVHLVTLDSAVDTIGTTTGRLNSDVSELNKSLGSTDISGIGDGTVTGAVSMLNKKWFSDLGNGTITITQAGVTKGSFTTNQAGNTTIALTDNNTTYSDMRGATSSTAGIHGLVPAPAPGKQTSFLRGDGTWAKAEQDLSAYYNNANYDTENNKLQLMNGDTVLKEIDMSGGGDIPTIVSFADGTDEEILAMIQAHYDDKINLSDYWAIGDTRTVHLSAMSATSTDESHKEQDVQFVIAAFDHDELAVTINGHAKAAVTLSQKNCLNIQGYIDSSGTYSSGWEGCERRNWCNNVYYNSIQGAIKNGIKLVNKKNYRIYNSANITSTFDYCFLLSETEVFGRNKYSIGSAEGTQYEYYKTSSNRVKKTNENNNYWWLRSPSVKSSSEFCYVNSFGDEGRGRTQNDEGIAPCLCI